MVLIKTSPQYKFLQVLTTTYLAMYNGLQSAICISNPSIGTDCTDPSDYLNDSPPSLPQKTNLYTVASGPDSFSYSDYTDNTYWYGLNTTNFKAPFTTTLNTAAVSVLYAACAANSTCVSSYTSTGASNADAVIQALVTTNINTISAVLKANPKLSYFPLDSSRGDAVLAQVYTTLPNAGNQLYGVNDGVLAAIGAGTVNANTYLVQRQAGELLQGGFGIWEILIHAIALGSYGYNLSPPTQSNINLTAPQVFTKLVNGGLDTKRRRSDLSRWRAAGVPRSKPILQRRLPSHLDPATNPLLSHRAVCTPPSQSQGALSFLQAIDSACRTQSGFLSAAVAPRAPMAAPLAAKATAGLPSSYNAQSFADVLLGYAGQICGSGANGYPCYPGVNVWSFSASPSVYTFVANVANTSVQINGANIQAANLFCAGTTAAIAQCQADLNCCNVYCAGPSCQSQPGDSTPGTGIC